MKKQYFLIAPLIALIAVLSFAALPLQANLSVAAEQVKQEAESSSMSAQCDKPCCQKKQGPQCDKPCCQKKQGPQCDKPCCQKMQGAQCDKLAKCANCEKKAQCNKCCRKGEACRHCNKPCKQGPGAARSGVEDEALGELFEKDKS